MPLKNKILEVLEKDARLSPAEIAAMVSDTEENVRESIKFMEKDGTILGYRAIINPEKKQEHSVSCLIEVSVQPERGYGFDKIAERIYKFPEVKSVFLVSGRYDLLVLIEGKTMQDIADFVVEKLSTLANVRSTASCFLLKKYKELGTILVEHSKRERIPVTP